MSRLTTRQIPALKNLLNVLRQVDDTELKFTLERGLCDEWMIYFKSSPTTCEKFLGRIYATS